MNSGNKFYNFTVEEALEILQSDSKAGLFETEAQKRLSKFGYNQLREKKTRSALSIFLEQFKDFIIWVLIGAALVSGFLKEWVDALAIVAIVILNSILGFIQEYRAEKSLAALKKLSSPNSKVIREGNLNAISSSQLVPGDIIELEAGDNIPADSRLIWATSNFGTQEASLTGESTPVHKDVFVIQKKDVPLADRSNMVYMGTSVASGKARAMIVDTGMETELGKIAGMIQEIGLEETPLQKKLEQFGKWILYLCFVIVALVFALELVRGGKIVDVFLTAVSLAVAAIPEGLPTVVTIALALGVQRMVKRHALIRKLPSVETLGCATIICSDKTGTLTKNEMTVKAIFTDDVLINLGDKDFTINNKVIDYKEYVGFRKSLFCGSLCNSANIIRDGSIRKVIGDPTEGAILLAALKLNLEKDGLEKENSFVEEVPFDSVRKKMAVVRKVDNKYIVFVKGAPEAILKDCTDIEIKGERRRIIPGDQEKVHEVNNQLANQAMRVLAVAYREFEENPKKYDPETLERELTFVGLIAMIDPPREEVKKAIQECKSAGIKTVMITGDHKNTAVAIARELGFFADNSLALTGVELDALDDVAFNKVIENISVYARVSPEHKLRIVKILRSRGEIVAMTGDGVNDAPAVKEADIGVSMGITGTDVTKEVSDMVITDDNFASIVAAVEEGRGIYDNIKKFVHYLLSCNVGEILVMLISSLIGFPVPLLPIQILWINLVTDGLPALALGMDPVDQDIMQRPPRKTNQSVVTKRRIFLMLAQGAFIAFCSLLAFCFILFIEKEGIGRARTAAFVVLSCAQLFHSFNCRNITKSLFSIGLFTNIKLIAANLISFSLQVAVVYIPALQKVFKTEALSIFDWFLVFVISSFPLWAMEIIKVLNKRMNFLKQAEL